MVRTAGLPLRSPAVTLHLVGREQLAEYDGNRPAIRQDVVPCEDHVMDVRGELKQRQPQEGREHKLEAAAPLRRTASVGGSETLTGTLIRDAAGGFRGLLERSAVIRLSQ